MESVKNVSYLTKQECDKIWVEISRWPRENEDLFEAKTLDQMRIENGSTEEKKVLTFALESQWGSCF